MPRRDLIAAVSSAAAAALPPRGWRKRAGEIYTLDLGAGFLAWLGISRAVRYHPMELHPNIGVVHEPTMMLEAKLSGVKPSMTATLSEPLVYFAGKGNQTPRLVVAHPAEAAAQVARLTELVDTHGLPFARSKATPDALIQALRSREHLAVREYALTRLPAALAALGATADALEAMASSLRELGQRADPAAEHVRRFAEALSRHLAE